MYGLKTINTLHFLDCVGHIKYIMIGFLSKINLILMQHLMLAIIINLIDSIKSDD